MRKLDDFTDDLYDVIAHNTNHITLEQFIEKWRILDEETELCVDGINNIINVGDFIIKVEQL